ncbi:MAG: hypothetical protein PUJ13_10650 [Bacteroidales bacterium]|nr:hypothetical protein [Bacteroidales bacterium]MDD7706817.1 hypothetical protein [Bacteroidales bacterium]MDY5321285.1 hypothetical protein [Prevotella sp.]
MQYEKEFEELWSSKPFKDWMAAAPSRFQEQLRRSKGMNTAGDWLALVPIALVIVYMDRIPVDNELLRFGIAALAILAWFVVWELIKPYVTNKRSESEIRDEVRQYFHQEWKAGRLRKD